MDSSRMNRGCCGANNMQNRRAASNNMELKMEPRNFPRKMQHVDHMIPAMAYVPMQRFEQIYDLSAALKNGTLFPEKGKCIFILRVGVEVKVHFNNSKADLINPGEQLFTGWHLRHHRHSPPPFPQNGLQSCGKIVPTDKA